MNSIQRYLAQEAITAIQNATGNLIKDGEIDSLILVTSMQELITYLKKAESEIKTKIDYPFKLTRFENRLSDSEKSNLKPIFTQPR